MPAALPILAGAGAYTAISTAIPGAIGVFLGVTGSIVASHVSANVFGLTPKPQRQDPIGEIQGRRLVLRSSTEPRRVPYGRTRVGGVLAYGSVTDREGNDNAHLHLVIAMLHGQTQAMGDVYVGDDVVTGAMLDVDGNVSSGRYADTTPNVHVEKFLIGSPNHITLAQTPETILSVSYEDFTFANEGAFVQPETIQLQATDDELETIFQYRLVGSTIFVHESLAGREISVNYTSGPTTPHVRLKKYLGAPGQVADPDLVAEDQQWTTAHVGNDITYIYPRLRWKYEMFPGGVPAISAVCKGRKVYDPRVGASPGVTAYTVNPALCIRDWLTAEFGFNCSEDEINDDDVIAAANVCEERVSMAAYSTGFTVDVGSNFMTLEEDEGRFGDGDGVRFTSSSPGTLPAPLQQGVTYYFIERDAESFRVASSYDNAIAGTPITITDAGSGTFTIHHHDQARYQLNGTANLGNSPRAVLEQMLAAMAGTAVWTGGKWRIFAGAYSSPAVSLDEDDLRGPMTIMPAMERATLFNAVRGVCTNPARGYVPDEFPPYENANYAAEDDEVIFRDVHFDFVANFVQAQRIAKIILERSRQAITVQFPAKFTAFKVDVMDTVQLSIEHLGWTNKTFLCVGWTLGPDGHGVDLVLQEEASSSYDWNSGEQTSHDPSPNTSLPDPRVVANAAYLILASGVDHLLIGGDGTTIVRIKASWQPSPDEFVQQGGRYKVQWKKAADLTWTVADDVPGDQSETYLGPAQAGVLYMVRIIAVNALGVRSSAWVVASHTVVGKSTTVNLPDDADGDTASEPPADVTGFSAQQNADAVVFRWSKVMDRDLNGYEIRLAPMGGSDWNAATPVTQVTKGTQITTKVVPPGSWTFFIKAVDRSGNFSEEASTYDLEVEAVNFDILAQEENAPDWLGEKVNLLQHWTGKLVPDSTKPASQHTLAELFEQYVPYPYAVCTYTAPELDAGADVTLRTWADTSFELGRGQVGDFSPQLQIDTHLAAGAYDGFADWSIGTVEARFVTHKLVIDTTAGALPVITAFTPAIDAEVRTERGSNVAIGASGTAITFERPFTATPSIRMGTAGSAVRIWAYDNESANGFTAHGYDAAGVQTGGTVNWEASGT